MLLRYYCKIHMTFLAQAVRVEWSFPVSLHAMCANMAHAAVLYSVNIIMNCADCYHDR